MKVNMTPNPLDVVTIHASQGDTEARQWEFELHNNGELIDTSEITEQLFFKAYKGGTEQILPENTSTPITSPFLGDIKYPQGLLTDQEFLYRESPTEEDGLAKITDIKGNTLVWNQLIRNGNFADTSNWSEESGVTLSISNNIATISSTTVNNGIIQYLLYPLMVGHKYLIKGEFNVPTEYRCVIGTGSAQGVQTDKLISTANTWTEVSGIETCTGVTTSFYCYVKGTTYENVKIRNVICFDLTQMGLDSITDPSDFTSLFSLPYYGYNAGTLLSFNGNGIKTVGKNLLEPFASFNRNGVIGTVNANGEIVLEGSATASFNILKRVYLRKGSYKISGCYGVNGFYTKSSISQNNRFFIDSGEVIFDDVSGGRQFEITADGSYDVRIVFSNGSDYTFNGEIIQPMIRFAETDETFEPYTSSTLSLPISTYFPTGMKSAGTAYDELTPRKAITRIGAVDLGSLPVFYYTPPTSDKPIAQFFAILPNTLSNVNTNVRCALYTASSSPVYGREVDKTVCTFNGRVYICDSAYTDATAFKTAMSGVYLYYELKTPTETEFTTASLVTENAEIPLSNDDGTLIGKCTEELSAEPGFHDAKIKLTDSDGECYSNKIQLHIERSPQ